MQVVSAGEDEATSTTENHQFEIEFKADYDTYNMHQVQNYEKYKTKAYALLWERCAKLMKTRSKLVQILSRSRTI